MPRLVPLLNFIFGATKLYFRNLSQYIYSNAVGELTVLAPTTVNLQGGATANTCEQDFKLTVVGKGIYLKEGTNATMGITSAMVAGTTTVSTTKVTTSSRIFLTAQSTGAAPGALRVSAVTAGTSFVITSSNAGDTSTVAWLLIEPS